MSRTILRRIAPAIMLTVGLAACSADTPETDATAAPDTTSEAATEAVAEDTAAAAFPVTVTHDLGEVTFDEQPTSIVSLSATATEMLFAMGAGDQVVAVDSFSNFPAEAPTDEDLSAFEPSAEAILGFEPDLVITAYDANDLVASLTAVEVPVLVFGSASDLDTAYAQWAAIGEATGHAEEAAGEVAEIQRALSELADPAAGAELTYYHELDATLYSATGSTFIGEIYGLFGLTNIADAADADGAAFGYPQLSAEYIVEQDPDLVFLACTVFCAETATTFAERDGFGSLQAVQGLDVIEMDDDVVSRWGPRVVEFATSVAKALAEVG